MQTDYSAIYRIFSILFVFSFFLYLCRKFIDMKVKEFIEQLQHLDSERDIWIVYDTFVAFVPEVDLIDEEHNKADYGNIGDYAIFVG